MKKTYNNPETTILVVATQQMVCESQTGGLLGNEDDPSELDLTDVAETDATNGNLGRRTLWDEEEEEEY